MYYILKNSIRAPFTSNLEVVGSSHQGSKMEEFLGRGKKMKNKIQIPKHSKIKKFTGSHKVY